MENAKFCEQITWKATNCHINGVVFGVRRSVLETVLEVCAKFMLSSPFLAGSRMRWDETRPTDNNSDNSRMVMVMVMTVPLPPLIPYSLFHDEHINFYCLCLLLHKAMIQRICASNNADTRRDALAHIHKTRSTAQHDTARLSGTQLILHALQRSK